MVVRDRNDDDQIVACVQRDGKYQWNMINGIYVYIGQFIVSSLAGDRIMNTYMLENNLDRKP